jgi:hypothetical protein
MEAATRIAVKMSFFIKNNILIVVTSLKVMWLFLTNIGLTLCYSLIFYKGVLPKADCGSCWL